MSFLWPALFSCFVISVLTSIYGPFVISKKTSLMGESISHALIPGVGLGVYFGGPGFLPMFIGAFVSLVLYSVIFNLLRHKFAHVEDSLFAVFQVAMLSIGAILISQLELEINITHILLGNIFAVTWSDFWFVFFVGLLVVFSFLYLKRHLYMYFFDSEHYRALIGTDHLIKFYFDLSLGIVLILSLQTVGALLSLGLLVLPSLTALQLQRNFKTIFIISFALSSLSCVLGLWLSSVLGWPAGPGIVICAFVFFLAGSLFKWEQKV